MILRAENSFTDRNLIEAGCCEYNLEALRRDAPYRRQRHDDAIFAEIRDHPVDRRSHVSEGRHHANRGRQFQHGQKPEGVGRIGVMADFGNL